MGSWETLNVLSTLAFMLQAWCQTLFMMGSHGQPFPKIRISQMVNSQTVAACMTCETETDLPGLLPSLGLSCFELCTQTGSLLDLWTLFP